MINLEFLKNIRHLGMRVVAYEHTINEVLGIIEGAKHWIGNPEYDASLASETAYYFVANNWTVAEVDELSCNLRTKLADEYNITIDNTEYPKVEDIKTPYEADIKNIVNSFSLSNKRHAKFNSTYILSLKFLPVNT